MGPTTATPPAPKVGRIRRGWILAKSSWRVMMLDKELAAIPLLGLVFTVLAFVFFGGALAFTSAVGGTTIQSGSSMSSSMNGLSWIILILGYVVMTTISNFFAGAVIHGANTRFTGGDPTVSSSLKGVRAKFKPLFLFSLLATTVGLVLQIIEERVPLGGKIAVWIAGAAWNIATFFALPIIVLGDKEVSPFEATKQSAGMVRQIWGESVVAQAGIGLISVLLIIPYVLLGGILSFGLASTGVPVLAVGSLVGLLVLGLFAIILVTSVLSGIVKAALYHFATTGEAPESFDRNLLRTAMTPKKARGLFS